MSAQDTDKGKNNFSIMCCSKCNHRLEFFMSDPKGKWKCINPKCKEDCEVKPNEP